MKEDIEVEVEQERNLDDTTPEERANFTQKEIEAYYTKERFPSLKYGPAGSPNPPHMRGRRGEPNGN